MKGNLVVRLMAIMVVLPILIAHFVGQVDLLSPTWLWISLFAGVMGLQATYTGFCPAALVSKFSKTGECCPGGSCGGEQDPKSSMDQGSLAKAEQAERYEIKVLGTGCANCNNTYQQIEKTAQQLGLTIEIEKVEDIAEIAKFGVMTTPTVVVNGQIVHSGGVPSAKMVESWFK